MKASTFLTCFALLSFVFASNNVHAEDNTKIKIASFIGVEIGGDIAQYEETLSLSRNQTRKMYMDEVVDAAVKLSGGIFDPSFMLAPLQRIQDAADSKRDINKAIDSIGIGFSVGEFFKTAIEKLYTENGITNAERKITFANMFPMINGRMMYNSSAQYDHYVFVQMAHVGGGQFRISATLGSLNDGSERTYEGEGYLEKALYQAAEGLFRSVMTSDRPAWKNPNPTLTWVPGPTNLSSLDPREARSFCSAQGARLPLADELILASHGTAYRKGGIDRLDIGENYFVADQMRQMGVPYVVIFNNEGTSGRATVQAVAGHLGKVWCVIGNVSERNTLIQNLYSFRRKIDPKGTDIRFFPENVSEKNLKTLKAIESLLINLNAPGAELDGSLKQEDLMSASEALEVLSAAGIVIENSPTIKAIL